MADESNGPDQGPKPYEHVPPLPRAAPGPMVDPFSQPLWTGDRPKATVPENAWFSTSGGGYVRTSALIGYFPIAEDRVRCTLADGTTVSSSDPMFFP